MNDSSIRRNPSRKECEDIIRRILMTEELENGSNKHFKNSTDFMKYFESLYLAGDSLTKQVQRAIKAMNMPKDAQGYYIINKTPEQVVQDKELSFLLQKSGAATEQWQAYETLFLRVPPTYKDYLLQLIQESDSLKNKYITILNTSDGLLFYTENAARLQVMLDSLNNYQTT
jgi:hypothetical protein